MQSIDCNNLPKAVYTVGDRIGLNFSLKRKQATEAYVEQNQESRLVLSHLKNSFYSLDELKTRKAQAAKNKNTRLEVKNPLKLNARLRKKLYKLTDEERRALQYSDMEPVHRLWQQYAQKIIETKNPSSIFHLDLHGCKLKCTASKNPTLVGSEGIVVQETRNTFLIVRPTSRLITLPKRESIFEFDIGDNKRFRIHGCNLLFTVQMRTKVKYKQKRHTSEV